MKQCSKTLTHWQIRTHTSKALCYSHIQFSWNPALLLPFLTHKQTLSHTHTHKKHQEINDGHFADEKLLKCLSRMEILCFFGLLLRSCGSKKPQLRRCVAFLGHNATLRPPIRPLIHPSCLISFIRLLLHTQMITHMPCISMGLHIQKNASWD